MRTTRPVASAPRSLHSWRKNASTVWTVRLCALPRPIRRCRSAHRWRSFFCRRRLTSWLRRAHWRHIVRTLGVIVATDIIMPQLGESIAEGTVVEWLIPLGGTIEKDQSLLEVETEKVDLEVPSPATGLLNEILVKEGETVAVGTLLARIESAPPAEVISRVGGVVVRPAEQAAGEEHHSPAVRQLAKEHAVDLSLVKGT